MHLSEKQLTRVFADTYGKTPLAYLTMLRVEEMARLLRETDLTIEQAGRQVGWRSRNRASEAFTQATGITPSRYRRLRWKSRAIQRPRRYGSLVRRGCAATAELDVRESRLHSVSR